MIDTIKIALNDLRKHAKVYHLTQTTEDTTVYIPKGDDRLSGDKRYRTDLEREVVHHGKSNSLVEKMRYTGRFNPSSHYKLRTSVNPGRDCIIYEFSIPKYFWGTNIIQSIVNPDETEFVYSESITASLGYQRDAFYSRFRKLIRAFFETEYPGTDIDYTDLEFLQVDVCWNQIFATKLEALEALQLKKEISKKHLRENPSQFYQNYTTAIFYGSSSHKCTIYHKGTEYASQGDRSKHEKVNAKFIKAGKKPKFDVDYFQNFADRMLRYEVSLRNEKLSYLYNEKIFRYRNKSYQVMKKIFNSLRSLEEQGKFTDFDSIKHIIKEYRHIYINGQKDINCIDFICRYFRRKNRSFDEVIEDHEYVNLLRKFMISFDRLSNTTRRFFFDLGVEEMAFYQMDKTSNQPMMETFGFAKFDKDMWNVCFDFLIDFINQYKIEKKSSLSYNLERLDVYNKDVELGNKLAKEYNDGLPKSMHKKIKPKIDRNKMSLILGVLDSYTLKEYKRISGMDDRTYYRYKSDLQKIGVTQNSLDHAGIIHESYDNRFYYLYLISTLGTWNVTRSGLVYF